MPRNYKLRNRRSIPFIESFTNRYPHAIFHSSHRLLKHFGIEWNPDGYSIKNATYNCSKRKIKCSLLLKVTKMITLTSCAQDQIKKLNKKKATLLMITNILKYLFNIDFDLILFTLKRFKRNKWGASSPIYIIPIDSMHNNDRIIPSIHSDRIWLVQTQFMRKLCSSLEKHFIDNTATRINAQKLIGANSAHLITNPNKLSLLNAYISIHTTTTSTISWIVAKSLFGCRSGKIMYEAHVEWVNQTKSVFMTFGFGTMKSKICGADNGSFGYGDGGYYWSSNRFIPFGKSFGVNDTITCAVDLDLKRIYFAKNGDLFVSQNVLLDECIWNKKLCPMLSFLHSGVSFNFCTPKTPCKQLIQNGFITFEERLKRLKDRNVAMNRNNKDAFERYTVNGIGGKLFRLSGWDGSLSADNTLFGKNGMKSKDVQDALKYSKEGYGLGAINMKMKRKKRENVLLKPLRFVKSGCVMEKKKEIKWRRKKTMTDGKSTNHALYDGVPTAEIPWVYLNEQPLEEILTEEDIEGEDIESEPNVATAGIPWVYLKEQSHEEILTKEDIESVAKNDNVYVNIESNKNNEDTVTKHKNNNINTGIYKSMIDKDVEIMKLTERLKQQKQKKEDKSRTEREENAIMKVNDDAVYLTHLLNEWQLDRYKNIVIDECGYDIMDDWKDLTICELKDEMHFKIGHAKRFIRMVQRCF